nr:MAG TPA: hypothetical protein [Caudoviricetes sp.]
MCAISIPFVYYSTSYSIRYFLIYSEFVQSFLNYSTL